MPQSTIRAQWHKGHNPPAGRHRTGEFRPTGAGRLTLLAAITAFGQPISSAAAVPPTAIAESKSPDYAVGGVAPRLAS